MTTINDVLFGGRANARQQLTERLAPVGELRTDLAPVAHACDALTALFDMPVGNVLLDAWYGNRLVRAACARTLATPGLTEEMRLLTTTVTCAYHPEIDLEAAGRRIVLVTFDLALELTLDSLVLEVAGGTVRAVGPGIGAINGTLKAGRVEIAERHTGKVRIGRALRLSSAPDPGLSAVTPRRGGRGARRAQQRTRLRRAEPG